MELKLAVMLIMVTMALGASKNKPANKVSILDSLSSSSSSPSGKEAGGDLQSEGSINLGFGTSGGAAIPWGPGYGWGGGGNCGGGYRPQYPSSSYTFGNPYGGFFG